MTCRTIVFAFALAAAQAAIAASAPELVEEGNAAFESGEYETALERYDAALDAAPDRAEIHYNRGAALYRQGDIDAAKKAFEQAADHATTDALRADALYNLGNCHYQNAAQSGQQDPGAAVKELESGVRRYEEALDRRPAFSEAAQNLEISRRALQALQQHMPPPQQQPSGQQSKQQENQPQQDMQQALQDMMRQQQDLQNQTREQQQQSQQGNKGEADRQAQDLARQQDALREQTQQMANETGAASNDPSKARNELSEAARKQQEAADSLRNRDLDEASRSQEEAAQHMANALDAMQQDGQPDQAGEPDRPQPGADQDESNSRRQLAQNESTPPENQDAAAAAQQDAETEGDESWPFEDDEITPEDILRQEKLMRDRRAAAQRRNVPVEKDW